MTPTEMHIEALMEKIDRLKAERDEYKKALEFYASRENWKFESYKNDCKDVITFSDVSAKNHQDGTHYACGSGGNRAREILKKWEGKQ